MGKILLGVATAALWFALSHAANAGQVCRPPCEKGSCGSRCLDRPVIGDRNDHDRGPGTNRRAPGGTVEIGR